MAAILFLQTEVNGWGIELDKAVRNRDGTLTVTLDC